MKLTAPSIAAAFLFSVPVLSAQGSYATYGTGCAGTGTGLGASHVVPSIYATAFGGSDNAIPIWPQPTKYQQVFDASEFPAAYTIGGLGLRRDDHASVEVDGALVSLEIKLGYTTHGPTTLSPVFADNFDLDAPITVLPQTLVQFPDKPGTPLTDPQKFDVIIPFTVPFDYVPGPGKNVLIQIVQSGSSSPGYAYVMDAGGGGTTARLFGSPDTATSGTLEGFSYGLVMNFYALTDTAVPLLTSNQSPQIGNDFPVLLSQAAPFGTAVLVLGLSSASWQGVPLPLDLTLIGAPGCSIQSSVSISATKTVKADGTAKYAFQIPLQLNLIGAHFYNQWAVYDPTANPLGFVFTNGGAGVIGSN